MTCRLSRPHWWAGGMLGAIVLTATPYLAAAAEAQEPSAVIEVASRGPRFLNGVGPAATPIDPGAVAALRRRVTLPSGVMTLEAALQLIRRESNVRLQYSRDVVPLGARLRLEGGRISLAAALTEVLLEAGVDVAVTGTDELVLIRRNGAARRQLGEILGRVTDAKTGAGVLAAEVRLEGTAWRTWSDSTGRYLLAAVDSGSYTLTVRRLGYRKHSREVTVTTGRADTVDVVLEPQAVALGELVTTATGQQRRRDLGNAITTIRADSVLRSAPIKNLTDLLANRVPGLTVQHTSGAPGDPARLRLRGLRSVMRSNDPVVIVDGVRIYATQSDPRSGNLTNLDPIVAVFGGSARATSTDVPAPSPLDQIDPNTIEKIEVFKGPSAATLYGADAANGVIVITTKRGKPGPVRWEVSLTRQRSAVPGKWPVGYYRFGHDDFTGTPMFCPILNVRCVQDSLVQFQALNDPDVTVFGTGHRTGVSLTASGGSQALTYSLTGTYNDETGILTLPAYEVDRFRTDFNREPPDWMRRPARYTDWSVRSNVTAILGPTAEVALSTRLSRGEQQRTSLEQQLAFMAGTYLDKTTGEYYRPTAADSRSPWLDPIAAVLSDYYTRQTTSDITFTTAVNANWRPRSWFNATGQAGIDVVPRDHQLFLPARLRLSTDSGAFIRGTGRSLVGTFNLQGAARKPLGRGFVFETSVGANLTNTSTTDVITSARGLVPGTSSLSGAQRVYAADSRTTNSVFGWYIEPRVSGQRLSLSTGLRLDGGSAYGARLTRSGGLGGLLSLPKLNGSWVISEEPWFPFQSIVSSLRLRGAYGQSQQQPGPADRLRLYTRSLYQSTSALTLTSVGNTGLRPERSVEFEGGLDADLFDSRLSVELTAFRTTTVDALMGVTLPPSVNNGGTAIRNIGTIRNTGLELTFGLTPIQTPLATWSATLNVSRQNNELVTLGQGVIPNPEVGIVAGYPVGGRWARPILGYADENGDGVLQPREIQVGDSLVFMGRLQPAYTTSLFTTVALFNGAVGVSAGLSYNAGAIQVDETARTNWVLARALADPTTPLSEQAAVVASTLVANGSLVDMTLDRTLYGVMQEVSTVRFNSLSVNYRLPARVAGLFRAQQMTIALQGSNLGLHSTYQGKDPDVNAWSAGEKIIDTGQLPLPRSWQVRFDVRY